MLPPQRRGFGSSLIERALAIETGGQATIHYEPDGVQCAIVLPASAIGSIGSSGLMSDDGIAPDEIAIVPEEKIRRRILLVEDSSLILMLLEEVMDGIGWDVVGPATRVAPAMVLAREENIDAALLDVNLAGEMSWDIAKILKERGVPFIFSTGYDGGSVLPAELAGSPVLGKPFKIAEVESRLKELIAARAKL